MDGSFHPVAPNQQYEAVLRVEEARIEMFDCDIPRLHQLLPRVHKYDSLASLGPSQSTPFSVSIRIGEWKPS